MITLEMESHHLLLLYGAVRWDIAATILEMSQPAIALADHPEMKRYIQKMELLRDELTTVLKVHHDVPNKKHRLTDSPKGG